ncbi:MAG: ATP-dependent sacrificial sulfur transferase LarE [Oscillibacter sp.]|nr:ATP-dependent sacrificial sulfur transferase LarE [Oscillibacter sp.]
MTENKDAVLAEKTERLQSILTGWGQVAVAFSGGTDSTFLLKTAHDLLGDHAVALTAVSCTLPKREREEAAAFCQREGIRQILCDPHEMEIEGFWTNPPDRCYHCKRGTFSLFREKAAELGFAVVADGSNADDTGDYRPGMRAAAELGIQSPLRDAGLTKADIRALSRRLNLPTWDKPSAACLASRVAYGEAITEEKMRRVDEAEAYLQDLGLRQVRLRVHGDLARIETVPKSFSLLLSRREEIAERCASLGFAYVTMDLTGYRTGSMNEVLGAVK